MAKLWIIVVGLLGAVGVAIGAYQAHGLKKLLTARYEAALGSEAMIPASHRLYRASAEKDDVEGLSPAEIDGQIQYHLDNTASAVEYQLFHTLAMLSIAILLLHTPTARRTLNAAAILMLLGVLGFSGGMYLVVFDLGPSLHWVIPIGGVLMIAGWLVLAAAGSLVASASPEPK